MKTQVYFNTFMVLLLFTTFGLVVYILVDRANDRHRVLPAKTKTLSTSKDVTGYIFKDSRTSFEFDVSNVNAFEGRFALNNDTITDKLYFAGHATFTVRDNGKLTMTKKYDSRFEDSHYTVGTHTLHKEDSSTKTMNHDGFLIRYQNENYYKTLDHLSYVQISKRDLDNNMTEATYEIQQNGTAKEFQSGDIVHMYIGH